MSNKLIDTLTWVEIVNKILKETDQESNSKFRKWLESKEGLKGTFFSSPNWLKCYNIYKKVNHSDDDHVQVTCGMEGCGKSTLNLQECAVVDPTFCKERILNTPLELFQWLKKNLNRTKGKAIQLDEGNLFLFSREAMKQGNISMIKLFALMRQANLFCNICVPNYQTIDSYIKQHRIDGLNLITKKHRDFTYYSKKAIGIINVALKKGVEMNKIRVPSGLFYGSHWNGDLPTLNDINKEGYLNIKDSAWKDFLDNGLNVLKGKDEQTIINMSDAVKLSGKKYETLKKMIDNGDIVGRKVGANWFIDKDSFLSVRKPKGDIENVEETYEIGGFT